MAMMRIVAVCVIAAIIGLTLRQSRPDIAVVLLIAAGVAALSAMLGMIGGALDTINALNERAGLEGAAVSTIVKVIGVAYLTEFGARVCADAGAEGLASKVELAGKLMMLTLSLPMLGSLLDIVMGILA